MLNNRRDGWGFGKWLVGSPKPGEKKFIGPKGN
jgi:hypothetical protein